jgi:hypothetical protein
VETDVTLAALDPWVVQFERRDGDDDRRFEALECFEALIANHPELEPLRFVDGSFWIRYSEFVERMEAQSPQIAATELPPLQDYGRVLSVVQCHDDKSNFYHSAAHRWLGEIWDALRPDHSPDWRDPIFVVPRCRESRWPSGELHIEPSNVDRLVVTLETPEENPLFVRDFDPWQCERVRKVVEDLVHRDLPRPAACEGSMKEWAAGLSLVSCGVTSTSTRLDFVPPDGWDPCAVPKTQWRDCPFGPHQKKVISRVGVKKGPQDRQGRIWDWDVAHHTHWDVQHESPHDDRRMNVRPDGVISRHYGK